MADKWYYRMFGHDFGPVTFNELKQLAELGAISSADEVRSSGAADWSMAGSISELGLKAESVSTPSVHSAVAEAPPQNSVAGADDWFCMFHGQELGPLSFDEIVTFAEQGQLEANDEVKLGAAGKWRRVGSIGRLVAVLPYHEPQTQERKVQAQPERNELTAEVATAAPVPSLSPAPTDVVAPVLDTAIVHAEATYAATDRVTKTLIAWALAPNVDPAWWGWIGGVEYGPVGFQQVYEWAFSGQLKASDFVRNGAFSQYMPAANLPGLFSAVTMMTDAKKALDEARASAAASAVNGQVTTTMNATTPDAAAAPIAAVTSAPAPIQPISNNAPAGKVPVTMVPKKSEPAIVAPQEQIENPSPQERQQEVRTPSDSRPGLTTTGGQGLAPTITGGSDMPSSSMAASSNSSSTMGSSPRPQLGSDPTPIRFSKPSIAGVVTTPPRPQPAPKRSSSGPGMGEMLANPKVQGGLVALFVVLLVAGWQFLPESTGKDREKYEAVKKLLDDVRAARAAKTTNFEPFKARAKKLTDDYTPILKKEASNARPAKQSLLFAIRDELPRMMDGNLAEQSVPEKNLEAHLKAAAERLRIK